MTYPHVIRLREPWKHSSAGPNMIEHRRHFNPPTELDPREEIWLVVDNAPRKGSVALNGRVLGSLDREPARSEFEITKQLATRNEITIQMPSESTEPELTSPFGDVSLEIRLAPLPFDKA